MSHQPISWSMAAISGNSVAVAVAAAAAAAAAAVSPTRPRAIPLAMITTRKLSHGFTLLTKTAWNNPPRPPLASPRVSPRASFTTSQLVPRLSRANKFNMESFCLFSCFLNFLSLNSQDKRFAFFVELI